MLQRRTASKEVAQFDPFPFVMAAALALSFGAGAIAFSAFAQLM